MRKINLLHGLFLHRGITYLLKKDLAAASKRNEAVPLLKRREEEESVYVLKTIDLAERRPEELKKEMEAGTNDDEDAEILKSIPRVGPPVSTAFLAYAGDPTGVSSAFSRK